MTFFICSYCELEKLDVDLEQVNASSLSLNVSPVGFSLSFNLSQKSR
jgi:hypothetical protein